jgi:hypothetical protein
MTLQQIPSTDTQKRLNCDVKANLTLLSHSDETGRVNTKKGLNRGSWSHVGGGVMQASYCSTGRYMEPEMEFINGILSQGFWA